MFLFILVRCKTSIYTWSSWRAPGGLDTGLKELFRFLPDAHRTLASEE